MMRMKGVRAKARGVALLAVAALLVTACGGGDTDETDPGSTDDPAAEPTDEPSEEPADEPAGEGEAAGSGETFQMRIGNETANDVQEELGELFVARVEEASEGRIEGEFFTAGALGNNIEMLQSIQSGGLEGSIAPTAWMSTFVPELGVLSLPFLFPGESMEEMIGNIGELLEGEAGDLIRASAEEQGFRIISLFGIGPQVIYSSSPIAGLEDLQPRTFRVLPGDEHTRTFADWDVQGVAVPFGEVYTSVQQGVIDGGENPPDVLLKSGFHEVGPNIVETYHNALVSYITVSTEWYDSLPADLQAVVDEVGAELVTEGGALYAERQGAALEELKADEAVDVSAFPAEDLEEMERLNREGVWQVTSDDPVKGPVVEAFLADLEASS